MPYLIPRQYSGADRWIYNARSNKCLCFNKLHTTPCYRAFCPHRCASSPVQRAYPEHHTDAERMRRQRDRTDPALVTLRTPDCGPISLEYHRHGDLNWDLKDFWGTAGVLNPLITTSTKCVSTLLDSIQHLGWSVWVCAVLSTEGVRRNLSLKPEHPGYCRPVDNYWKLVCTWTTRGVE